MKKIETDPEKRWELGLPHHPESNKIKKIIKQYDTNGEFEFGGDGDNGETLLYILDVYFEKRDHSP